MAFVFRNEKPQWNELKTPGPGQYMEKSKNSPSRISSAPFNQSEKRKIWKENRNPGPGAYKTQQNLCKENKIVQNVSEKIVIYQAPKQSCPFKSSTKRFKDNIISNIGPGQYNLLKSTYPTKLSHSYKQTHNNPSKLKKYIIELNKLSGGQSISPELEIGKEETLEREKEKQYKIIKEVDKMQHVFASKVQRNQKIRPMTSAGPGSYNIATHENKKYDNQKDIKPSIQVKQSKPLKEQQQKLKAQLGPGTYFNKECSQNKITEKINKHEFFGSKVSRFNSIKQKMTPGPGNYDLLEQKCYKKQKSFHKSTSKSTFLHPSFSEMKITKQIQSLSNKFAQQRPNTSMQKRPNLFKKKAIIVDSFGSKQKRFQDKQINIKSCQQNKAISEKKLMYFTEVKAKFTNIANKKTVKRNTYTCNKQNRTYDAKEDEYLKRLCYDFDNQTFQKKYKEKTQINAPFLSRKSRFQQSDKDQANIFDCLNLKQQSLEHHSWNDPFRKVIGGFILKSQEKRFDFQSKNQINPQTYHPIKPSKKQFNALFK